MSTPDQPDTPPLTRRRMREIRNTGSTPVIPPVDDAAPPAPEAPADTPAVAEEAAPVAVSPTPAPLAREAAPAPVAPAPDPVDLGVAPLTRRQARQQERIRTASVPIITPEVAASLAPPASPVAEAGEEAAERSIFAPPAEPPREELTKPSPADAAPAAESDAPTLSAVLDTDPEDSAPPVPVDDEESASTESESAEEQTPVLVNPALGSGLLAGASPAADLPPSFDQLITRSASATGSISTPNALILSQTPAGAPLVAPVTATGEVLITGTFDLPDGLGSVGHAPGMADGKDLDVALVDGELPPASSPTPIAASAAISTVRTPGEEIIRPPVPEKGSRLMLGLVIVAGVAAAALATVLILILTTGALG
jgi:hypothetical protein